MNIFFAVTITVCLCAFTFGSDGVRLSCSLLIILLGYGFVVVGTIRSLVRNDVATPSAFWGPLIVVMCWRIAAEHGVVESFGFGSGISVVAYPITYRICLIFFPSARQDSQPDAIEGLKVYSSRDE